MAFPPIQEAWWAWSTYTKLQHCLHPSSGPTAKDASRKAPLLEALFVPDFSLFWVDLAKQGQNGTSMNKCAGVTEKWKQLENDNQRKVKDLVPGLPAAAESLFRWPPDNLSQREGTLTYYGLYSLGFFSHQMQEQSVLDALPFPHNFRFRLWFMVLPWKQHGIYKWEIQMNEKEQEISIL